MENIGQKIKSLATVTAVVGVGCSIVLAIIIFATGEDELIFPGFIVAIVGSISSWVSSILIRGFGQLVENSDKLVAANPAVASSPTVRTSPSKVSTVAPTTEDKLRTLNYWRDQGIITEEDYLRQVEKLQKGQ